MRDKDDNNATSGSAMTAVARDGARGSSGGRLEERRMQVRARMLLPCCISLELLRCVSGSHGHVSCFITSPHILKKSSSFLHPSSPCRRKDLQSWSEFRRFHVRGNQQITARKGKFPHVDGEYAKHFLKSYGGAIGDKGQRILILGKKPKWGELSEAEVRNTFGIPSGVTQMYEGNRFVWKSPAAVPTDTLEAMTCVRAQIAPLSAHHETVEDLIEEVGGWTLACDGWDLHVERLKTSSEQEGDGERRSRMEISAMFARCIVGAPNFDKPNLLFTLLESSKGYLLGLTTWSHNHAQRSLSEVEWSRRPCKFSSALPLLIAEAAVNIAGAREGDLLLDPCCGSGTILYAALERGLNAVGFEINPSMAMQARKNLETVGYATRGGGRESLLMPVTHVVSNLPFGKNLKVFAICGLRS
ncbi:hypothetical protein GUITHDRAFT_114280 [Guillardia theta CCMP2712]|uniref:Ribosomal RNA large subunit methyltransferase K/L-like methyltransferase domain-containing protein n=1 Tax=Guillardia theta (strain CCMP2712) TaxID=905079 RepID=L1ITV8_GUITC|nr:hypothetical protein GUITHDRAFT_114280 [Guillardia theta CCMP2712]EKX39552.1 hypothetical protein GUITHDRAFT_114280 [Guillardia theta CCMP2712]|eukprot:XP_005826532.1 hypothetical protein GUITHDRAFT_114280 [Guillardia theta CCMP2712]